MLLQRKRIFISFCNKMERGGGDLGHLRTQVWNVLEGPAYSHTRSK